MSRVYAYILLSAAGVACFASVDVVYFTSAGYTLAFVGVMYAAFNLSVTAAELPFAVLFDRYSNKLALQLGNLLRIIAFALFFANLSQPSLIVAQALAGIAAAAMSGTSDALIVNHVRDRTDAPDADTTASAFARISYLAATAGIVGGVLGIALYAWWPSAIWLAAIAFFVAAGAIIAGFRDSRPKSAHIPLRAYVAQVAATLRAPHAWLLVLAGTAAIAPFLLWQVKFNQVSLALLALGFIGMKAASLLAPAVLKVFRVRVAHVAAVALANVAAVTAFAFSAGGVAVWSTFVLHVLLHAALGILCSGLFHDRVANEVRATAGSIVSMTGALLLAIVAPAIALLGQHFGLPWSISVSALIYLAVAGLSALLRRR